MFGPLECQFLSGTRGESKEKQSKMQCVACEDQQECVTPGCLRCNFEPTPGPEEEEENQNDHGEDSNRFSPLLSNSLFMEFERHEKDVRNAHAFKRKQLEFQSSVKDVEEMIGETNMNAARDVSEGLGVRLPGDDFQGDVNFRTLQALLTRVDQRGFERCFKKQFAPPLPSCACT